jgi:hypothetical protein
LSFHEPGDSDLGVHGMPPQVANKSMADKMGKRLTCPSPTRPRGLLRALPASLCRTARHCGVAEQERRRRTCENLGELRNRSRVFRGSSGRDEFIRSRLGQKLMRR